MITGQRLLFPCALVALLACLFFDCVGWDLIFAFRDSAHFYPPLYGLVRDEWLAGRPPLWNPLANGGQPLAASGTAGAFYPPQLLLSLVLSPPMAVNVYAIGHLALAAVGAYRLAREQRRSRAAASVAGMAYGFSGSLLFQVYNPIFAAGAAWLVWGLCFGWRLLNRGGIRNAVGLAMALACAVLCGDPQAAFHCGMILGAAGLFWKRPILRSGSALGLAAVLGGLMCLVQILLSGEFIRETERGMDLAPQSIWQLPEFFSRMGQSPDRAHWYDVFIGRPPQVARHYELTYDFSTPPWRLIELMWPGFSGTQPSRWTLACGIESPRIWVSSLYSGTVVFVLGITAACFFRPRRQVAFWIILAGASAWASFGGYGGVGIARNAWSLATGRWNETGYLPGDEVGGLYWWMTTFLPAYHGFRYPAKCLTILALAVSQLGGLGLDLLRQAAGRRVTSCVSCSVGVGMILATIAAATIAFFTTDGAVFTADRRDYPLADGVRAMVAGGMQAAVVAFALWFAIRCQKAGTVLVGLLAIDLALAGRRDIVVGRHENLVESAAYVRALAADRLPALVQGSPQMRIAEINGEQPSFRYSTAFPEEHLRYLGLSMVSNTPWLHGQGSVGWYGTATQADTDMLLYSYFDTARTVLPRRTYDLYGVEFFIVENSDGALRNTEAIFQDWSAGQKAGLFAGMMPGGESQETLALRLADGPDDPTLVYAVRNESALPRVRILRDAIVVPVVSRADWDSWIDLLKRIAFPNPEVPDLTTRVIIEETPGLAAPSPVARTSPKVDKDRCTISLDEPQRVVIEADLSEPGFLVLADTFHDDWKLTVQSAGLPALDWPVLRANRVHRACRLPAGRHVVEYRFRSKTFEWSALVTMLAWGVGGALLIAGDRAKRPLDAMIAACRKRFSVTTPGC